MKLTLNLEAKFPTGALGLALAPDGAEAFVSCADGTIQWVDLDTGESSPLAEKHASFASSCVLLPDGKTLISGGYDGVLIWHDAETGRCLRRVTAHQFWNWQLALSPDGKRVAATTGQYAPGGWKYEPAPETEPSVKVFDTATGERLATFAHTPPVMSCAFSPDGQHLAAGNIMGEVRVWNFLTASASEPVSKWTSPDFTSWGTIKSHHYIGGIYGLAFSPDGKSLLGCGMGPMVDPMAGNGKMTWQRWDWQKGAKLDEIKDGQRGSGLMESLSWHPNGKHFVMAGRQAQGTWNAAVFDSTDGNLVQSLDTKMRITHAYFSPDGKSLITSGAVGQPKPDSGVWPSWGRLQTYSVEI
jgi:WD40 repeat protein